ncbi:MAG: LysR family transcriptional regulator [Rhizobiales bacterium]|nr:LysR family transcriptional regulator [Hyphomicrobiales bacterium]
MALDLLRKGLKLSHLRLLVALAEHGKISKAAEAIGITQPAASRLASEIENLSGTELYHRTGRGIQLTPLGVQLAFRSSRILQEIGDAGRDIEEMQQGLAGRVRVGSVTGPAIEYVLPAIRYFRLSYPGISIEVEVATSDVLAPMLAEGRLDFALCRLPSDYDPSMFRESQWVTEPVSLVARSGHPLLRDGGKITNDRLLQQDWVLPPVNSILRNTVERELRNRGLPLPARVLTTSSFLFTLAMVQKTNAVAPLASAVTSGFTDAELGTGAIINLPTELEIKVEPYSILTRAGQALTPAAHSVFEAIQRMLLSATDHHIG